MTPPIQITFTCVDFHLCYIVATVLIEQITMSTITNKSDVVRARIESKVKRDAEGILKRLGVSHSTFINMSYRAVIEAQGIPLSLHVPNKETAKVLRDAQKPAKRAQYKKASTLAEFTAAMGSSKR